MPKISELTELAEAPAADDMFAIVDSSAGQTKKIRADRVGGTATGFVDHLFAFPAGDITGWRAPDGTPIDDVVTSDWTVSATTNYPGPSGFSMEFVIDVGVQAVDFVSPAFDVEEGQIVEYKFSAAADGPNASYIPVGVTMLWWTTALLPSPAWDAPQTSTSTGGAWGDFGQTLFLRPVISIQVETVIEGSFIVPAGVVQAAIKFGPDDSTLDGYQFNVQGLYVKITTPSAIS